MKVVINTALPLSPRSAPTPAALNATMYSRTTLLVVCLIGTASALKNEDKVVPEDSFKIEGMGPGLEPHAPNKAEDIEQLKDPVKLDCASRSVPHVDTVPLTAAVAAEPRRRDFHPSASPPAYPERDRDHVQLDRHHSQQARRAEHPHDPV